MVLKDFLLWFMFWDVWKPFSSLISHFLVKFVLAVLVLTTILPLGHRPICWIVSAGLAQVSEFSFVLGSRARRAGIISREVNQQKYYFDGIFIVILTQRSFVIIRSYLVPGYMKSDIVQQQQKKSPNSCQFPSISQPSPIIWCLPNKEGVS